MIRSKDLLNASEIWMLFLFPLNKDTEVQIYVEMNALPILLFINFDIHPKEKSLLYKEDYYSLKSSMRWVGILLKMNMFYE